LFSFKCTFGVNTKDRRTYTYVHCVLIDPESELHTYQQVAADIRRRIEAGEWRRRLPSLPRLEHEYGVARQTVRKALALLEDLGVLYTKPYRGTFVRHRVEVMEVRPGARLFSRPANDRERTELDLDEHGWVTVVEHADGRAEAYPVDRVEFRVVDGFTGQARGDA